MINTTKEQKPFNEAYADGNDRCATCKCKYGEEECFDLPLEDDAPSWRDIAMFTVKMGAMAGFAYICYLMGVNGAEALIYILCFFFLIVNI